MFRRIVTLLALLSGLTVFGAPAQAALTQMLGSHAEASQSCEQARADEAIVQPSLPFEHAALHAPSGTTDASLSDAVAIPTVRFGIDRAFE